MRSSEVGSEQSLPAMEAGKPEDFKAKMRPLFLVNYLNQGLVDYEHSCQKGNNNDDRVFRSFMWIRKERKRKRKKGKKEKRKRERKRKRKRKRKRLDPLLRRSLQR